VLDGYAEGDRGIARVGVSAGIIFVITEKQLADSTIGEA
jgi:hypothetical protein